MPASEQHTASVLRPGEWVVEPARSSVEFSIKHMLFASVKGSFSDFEGRLAVGELDWRGEGSVSVASLDTGDRIRDERVMHSEDFFDVLRHPRMQFSSTSIDARRDGRLRIVGPLTLRGSTREIELDGRVEDVRGGRDGTLRARIALSGELRRDDFGLTWNQALDTGGVMLGSTVKIALRICARNAATVEA